MDCVRIEKLLALHAGGDLPARQARVVSAHLQTCEGCRRLAADFAAGRELLGAYEPPEFDAAFFDAVRRNVLSEIDSARRPSAFTLFLQRVFTPRALAAAATAAVLIAAVALTLKLRTGPAGNHNGPTQVAASGGDSYHSSVKAPDGPPRVSPTTVSPTLAAALAPTVPAPDPSPRKRQLASLPRGARVTRDAAPVRPDSPGGPESIAAAPPRVPGSMASAAGAILPTWQETAHVAQREMLRIELQTSDPNVRIIWLTPQASGKLPQR